jgi:hypothetical protein
LQALLFEPLTPLQSWSLRQSVLVLQIFTHSIAVPATASQIDSSGHSLVEPDIVHAFVQYPAGTVVSHISSSSHPSFAVQVEPTFGGSPPHATINITRMGKVRIKRS